jgi:hypothetical protein
MEVTQENINGITINKTDGDLSWRLIHNGEKVVSLFESSGITMTHYTIFLAATLEECETEIYVLNLEYNSGEE